MLVQLIIGALFAWTIVLLFNYARKHQISLVWWQWVITILVLVYAVFVVEVVVGFLGEGAPQAALVMGMLTGIFAVIWGVLLKRFIFAPPKSE